MSSIFGWGGVKVTGNADDAIFTLASGTLSFERVDVRNVTTGGKILIHTKGWRPIIDVEIVNASSTDITSLIRLAVLISISQIEGSALTVYPRYTSTDLGSTLSYSCFVDSNFAPEDIAQVDVGQTVRLRFIGEDLIDYIPINYSSQIAGGFIDDNDDAYVDESGNTYTLL